MQKLYFQKFIEDYIDNKDASYIFILWSVYQHIDERGKLSDKIKEELSNFSYSNKKLEELKEDLVNVEASDIKYVEKKFPAINSIQIKNFRGFKAQSEEDRGIYIDLDKTKNIFFGPNGSGKTSFCEAFEYKLTGNVKEARRRNMNTAEYVKSNKSRPELSINFNDSTFKTNQISEAEMEFFQTSFIEKNRLQEFALLGSRDTGKKEQDIIASLLGLEELDILVSSFVKPISFTIDTIKKNEYSNQLENLLKKNEKNISIKNHIKSESENIESKMLEEYQTTPSKVLEDIEVREKNIKDISDEIDKIRDSQIDIHSYDSFIKVVEDNIDRIKDYHDITNKLTENALAIDYNTFYENLKNLIMNEEKSETCPACDTPLEKVVTNPILKANQELNKLQEIKELQQRKNEIKDSISKYGYTNLKKDINIYQANVKNFEEIKVKILDEITILMNQHLNFDDQLIYLRNSLQKLVENKKDIKRYFDGINKLADKIIDKIEVNQILKKRKEKEDKDLINLKAMEAQYKDNLNRLNEIEENLLGFENELADLEKNVEEENQYNLFVDNIENKYKDFYKDIIQFKLDLEKERLLNIEMKTLEYYNKINKHDSPAEKITKLTFELDNNNYKIFLKMNNGEEMDAYSSLSEGHLRSLGLSLMLAVAEKNDMPFLIFDDVVNAIDSDHRANIIEMLFNDAFLKKTQLIITTHDRLFWERFCNEYGQSVNKKNLNNISYVINYSKYGSCLSQYDIGFESKIRKALQMYDIRQALIYCRIWFESVATKYCVDEKLEITAKFNRIEKGNLLKTSIESIYNQLNINFPNNEYLDIIKNDLINWSFQNQEHHSFDEQGLNLVHSKNSDEVLSIYRALKKFINDINPEKSLERLQTDLNHIEHLIQKSERLLQNEGFLKNADSSKVRAAEFSLIENKELREELLSEIERLNT